MDYEPVNFARKFSLFQEAWKPKVIAELNDYQSSSPGSRGSSSGTIIPKRMKVPLNGTCAG